MLKNILAHLLQQQDFELNKARFSKKIGITKETLMQILMGNTKNPGIYTMAKIADALDVSLDALVGRKNYYAHPNAPNFVVKNFALLEKIISYILSTTKTEKEMDIEKFLSCIREVYRFSSKKCDIDKEFANWYIETYLKTH